MNNSAATANSVARNAVRARSESPVDMTVFEPKLRIRFDRIGPVFENRGKNIRKQHSCLVWPAAPTACVRVRFFTHRGFFREKSLPETAFTGAFREHYVSTPGLIEIAEKRVEHCDGPIGFAWRWYAARRRYTYRY